MVTRAGAPYRSANAGELSESAAGRADIKQFYSAGLRFKNIEPVPLSGFRRMAGSYDLGPVRGRVSELARSGVTVTAGPHTGTQTIWQATVAGRCFGIHCNAIASSSGVHQVKAQAFAGGQWRDLSSLIDVGVEEQKLTFAAGPALGLDATQVRLRAVMSGSAEITCGAVTVLTESETQDDPRYASVLHDDGERYFLSLTAGFLDVFEDDTFVAGVYLPDVTEALLPKVNFYTENATIGLAHRNLETLRIRRSEASNKWVRDTWPYDTISKVDLGGTYAKTDDEWTISVPWTGDGTDVYITLSLTIDGETTPGLPFLDAASAISNMDNIDVTVTAASIKAAIEALPSLGPTVTVTMTDLPGRNFEIVITFGGDLSGVEYQLTSQITNTADAAALASHTQVGKTDFEPIFSDAAGWPGGFGLVQDRLVYLDLKAVPSAINMSQAGEYFKTDIDQAGANAPRLDKLRGGQSKERVLAVAEATYVLVFTDRAAHFASNRTISATEPLNFVQVATSGIVGTTEPIMLENKVYYIGRDPDPRGGSLGNALLSLSYSEIETTFDAVPEHIFASHLVSGVKRLKGQQASNDKDASKLWLLRNDGRLACACIIKSQEVLGFCEWRLAGDGEAREIHVDVGNDLRLAVKRSGRIRHERQSRRTYFQGAFTAVADFAGRVQDLEHLEGLEVWVEQDGYIEGPFTVAAGVINPGSPYTGPLTVGLWRAPVWESMPRYYITRNDEIVKRPGRIHSAQLEVIATTSIAVGANGEAAEELPLATTETAIDAPPEAFTGMAQRNAMLGMKVGTTLVVTQTRPGELRVRDITIEEKL
jgi:hypothetical protein